MDERKLKRSETMMILAYRAYYDEDPKLMNLLLTGVCHWPAQESYEQLIDRATEQLDDLEYLHGIGLGQGAAPLTILQLFAARKVLETMAYYRDNPEGRDRTFTRTALFPLQLVV